MDVNITSADLQALTEPIVPVVRSALEDGLVRLPAVRQAAGVEPDPWWDAHTIRHIAFTQIAAAETRLDRSGATWSLDQDVPNSGIHIALADANVRVCRGTPEVVPAPGPNRSRRRWWSQEAQLALFGQHVGRAQHHGPVNLLLLWDELTEDEVSLAIAVPSGCWSFGGAAKLHALVPLDTDALDPGEFAGDDDKGFDLIARIDDERDERGSAPRDR
jgi:hypothetical protein